MRRGDVYWYEHPEIGRRPWLVLTRTEAIPVLHEVLGVPATTTVRGIATEVLLDEEDGMPERCALTLDNVSLVRRNLCTERITTLRPERMLEVCTALAHAAACT